MRGLATLRKTFSLHTIFLSFSSSFLPSSRKLTRLVPLPVPHVASGTAEGRPIFALRQCSRTQASGSVWWRTYCFSTSRVPGFVLRGKSEKFVVIRQTARLCSKTLPYRVDGPLLWSQHCTKRSEGRGEYSSIWCMYVQYYATRNTHLREIRLVISPLFHENYMHLLLFQVKIIVYMTSR